MRRLTIVIALILLIGGAIAWVNAAKEKQEAITLKQDFYKLVENSLSDQPTDGLGYDWLDCLDRYWPEADKVAKRVVCKTWSAQGITSSLIALEVDDGRMPIVETRLANSKESDRILLHVVGGPGEQPFHVNPAMTEQFLARIRRDKLSDLFRGELRQSAYYQVLKRGYTIASVGYWGTHIRTVEAPDEIALAIDDVTRAVDFYSDNDGKAPPMIMESLGNHLALGALGRERLETMQVLALVPVMDGLQHHIARIKEEHAEKIANEEPIGEWVYFNIFKRVDEATNFDHSRLVRMLGYISRFVGDADLPWRNVSLKDKCSSIALGTEDPRTKNFLAAEENLPSFVKVWEADHNLFEDVPEEMQNLFAEYADCLIQTHR